jgi:hypothetical protein
MKNVFAERVTHKGERRIALRFEYDAELIKQVKSYPGARWSNSMGYWHIAYTRDNVEKLPAFFRGKANLDCSALTNREDLPEEEIIPDCLPIITLGSHCPPLFL